MMSGEMTTVLKRKLSPVDALLVLCVMVVLCAVGVFCYNLYARNRYETRLSRATERLYLEACKQRELLVSGIEAYRKALGTYPPDHIICQNPLRVDAVTNQLLYELLGTVHDATNEIFTPPHFPGIQSPLIRRFFGTEGFKNSVEWSDQLRHFLDVTNVAVIVVKPHPDPVGLAGIWPNWEGMDSDLFQDIDPFSWRYISSLPIHNVGKFDLWLEIKTRQTNIVVKNW
jgi:hypothetical protein